MSIRAVIVTCLTVLVMSQAIIAASAEPGDFVPITQFNNQTLTNQNAKTLNNSLPGSPHYKDHVSFQSKTIAKQNIDVFSNSFRSQRTCVTCFKIPALTVRVPTP